MILKNKITKIAAAVFVLSFFVFGQSAAALTSEEPKTQLITVISPNGGESYNRGQSISYKWNQNLKTKKLEVSIINASTSEVVYSTKRFDSRGNNTKFLGGAVTSGLVAGAYKIKICDAVNPTNPVCDMSNESFTITSTEVTPNDNDNPSSREIEIKSPNGGEVFAIGQNIPFKWHQGKNSKDINVSLVSSSTSEAVHILKKYEGRGRNAKIIMGKDTMKLSPGEYKLKICDREVDGVPACDDSDGYFSLTENSSSTSTSTKKLQIIEVKTPNGGESYDRGEKISYQWRQKTKANNLKISIIDASTNEEVYTAKRFDGGGLNKKIIIPTATAKIPAGQYLLVVCDKVRGDKNICDKSNHPFTITDVLRTIPEKDKKAEEIMVKSPNGGEVFTHGQNIPYAWHQTRNAKEMEISLINASSSAEVYSSIKFEGWGDNKNSILAEKTALFAPGQYKLQICNLETSACDLSNLPFTIN